MYRGWIFAALVFLAGCASQSERNSASVDDPRTAMITWPEWTPTSVALLELQENAGYTIVANAGGNASSPAAATAPSPAPVPEAPSATAKPAPPPTPVTSSSDSATPSSTEYVELSKKVSFAATADGSPPLFYQWRKNGQPIPGKTDALLTINKAKESDAGRYDCLVRNSAGEVASQPIDLVVRKP